MIIAVINRKGGVGKTTTIVNLGAALAGAGHKVLLFDLDPQGSLTSFVDTDHQRPKNCLVLDKEHYRYQQFISDISGQDVFSHEGDQQGAIREVRNWLASSSKRPLIPSGDKIYSRFLRGGGLNPVFRGVSGSFGGSI